MSTILCLMLFSFCMNAQGDKSASENIILNSGGQSNALIYLNGLIYEKKLYDLNPDRVGVIFGEGDSSYVSRTYGNSPDTSLIWQYFGEQRNRGILFVFTKDKVQTLSKRNFLQYIKDKKCKAIFKVNNSPLMSQYTELNLKKIYRIRMVKHFKLTKWDTGNQDVFTLFVIEAK